MPRTDFYVVLPTNVICTGSHDNTIGHYSTILPSELPINDREWEVGLVEISIPFSFFNITDLENNSIFIHTSNYRSQRCGIPNGYYTDGVELTNIINKNINRTNNFGTKFKYSVITRKIEIIIAPGKRLYLKGELLKLLGFDTHTRDFDNRLNDGNLEEIILVANQPLNFNLTSRNIYVHSNIARSTIIGNDYASIL